MRTVFLVDGFNLYNSPKDASRDLGGVGTRWLDLFGLCRSSLYLLRREARMGGVYYFSALARHLEAVKPDLTMRHSRYIECLRSTGVEVELAQFKEKWIWCPHCSREITRHEEKETDIAVAVRLLELCWRDQCDAVVLVTGDSDLAPAVRAAQRHFPAKEMYCFFPYARGSFELRSRARRSFKIKRDRYVKHQLPNPVVLPDGREIHKPAAW